MEKDDAGDSEELQFQFDELTLHDYKTMVRDNKRLRSAVNQGVTSATPAAKTKLKKAMKIPLSTKDEESADHIGDANSSSSSDGTDVLLPPLPLGPKKKEILKANPYFQQEASAVQWNPEIGTRFDLVENRALHLLKTLKPTVFTPGLVTGRDWTRAAYTRWRDTYYNNKHGKKDANGNIIFYTTMILLYKDTHLDWTKSKWERQLTKASALEDALHLSLKEHPGYVGNAGNYHRAKFDSDKNIYIYLAVKYE